MTDINRKRMMTDEEKVEKLKIQVKVKTNKDQERKTARGR